MQQREREKGREKEIEGGVAIKVSTQALKNRPAPSFSQEGLLGKVRKSWLEEREKYGAREREPK